MPRAREPTGSPAAETISMPSAWPVEQQSAEIGGSLYCEVRRIGVGILQPHHHGVVHTLTQHSVARRLKLAHGVGMR